MKKPPYKLVRSRPFKVTKISRANLKPARRYFGKMRGGGQGGVLSGDNSGGGGYVAKAVHFDGTAWLVNDSLTSTDNTVISTVGWIKMVNGSSNGSYAWCVDPDGDGGTFLAMSRVEDGGVALQQSIADAGVNNYEQWYTGANTPSFDVWLCYISTMDASGAHIGEFYIGDDNITANWGGAASYPFDIATNGKPFWFGTQNATFSQLVADVADWRVMPGISLLDGGGEITEATRRLFIDANGKPVDPAVAAAALGVPGAVLFSGDATSFGTNQGTGGAFTLTGALTNASTSPSD